MSNSYTKNYIHIYIWRTISIVSGFLSLLVVVPHLSNNQELYGIYSFCISFTLYLTYADIGFLGAGQKYAAEEFVKGNRKREYEIFGFTGMILLLMILPFSIAMFYFSIHPNIVINNLSEEGQAIAGKIFFIIGLISPFQVLLQRLTQSILIIRIKDYVSLRIDIIFNLIKIISVLFFFGNGKYMIVEYFLFINILTILGSFIVVGIIIKTEQYDFIHLIKSIKLSKEYFRLTKHLAFASLISTIGWLIYYELDLVIIGKWLGPSDVAIYAIGFTFLNFIRTLWNIIFSPYAQRFNHFSGNNDISSMKKMATKIIEYTAPLCIIVTTVLILSASYLVIFWVGEDYTNSILILQILITGTIFGFISNPASYYFVAKTKYKYIYATASFLPLVFISCIFVLVPQIGLVGFAISKTIGMTVGFIISIIGISKLINVYSILGKRILPVSFFITLSIIVFPWLLSRIFDDVSKSTTNLILLIFILGIWIFFGLIFNYLIQKEYRVLVTDFVKQKFASLQK